MPTVHGRKLLRDVLRGDVPDHTPFLPLVGSLAARVAGVRVKEFYTNPSTLVKSLTTAQRFLGQDAIFCSDDLCLVAEAAGANMTWSETEGARLVDGRGGRGLPDVDELLAFGRVPVVLEAAHRLRSSIGSTGPALCALIPGPIALAQQLLRAGLTEVEADAWTWSLEVIQKLVRRIAEEQPDAIFLVERNLQDAPVGEEFRSLITTCQNISAHFDSALVLTLREFCSDQAAPVDIVGLFVQDPAAVPNETWPGWFLGGAVPSSAFCTSWEALSAVVSSRVTNLRQDGRPFFLGTDMPLPYSATVENLRAVVQMINT